MAWKRTHTVVSRTNRQKSPGNGPNSSYDNLANILPEIYTGHPERISRYSQYDQMDTDSQINTALNTIADFSTQSDADTSDLFQIKFNEDPSDSEVKVIKRMLRHWVRINKFRNRLWRIFRNVVKYGDEIMIRDPETLEWYHVPPEDVQSVIINEAKGKKAEIYNIKNLNINTENLTAATSNQYGSNTMSWGTSSLQNPTNLSNYNTSDNGYTNTGMNMTPVDASNIVHLSLSEGLDAGWPFGTSILESVYKDYKQKQLLEDAILIYRIQRAPERRVFYVDVGNMPPHKAHSYVERIKNEIKQKRLPSRTGAGGNIQDARYDPLSTVEDYYFPQTADGRGSKVDTLPGGEGLGNINDLDYFNNKLAAGLNVPQSYLTNPGSSDTGAAYADGRPGTAYIQEFRFSEYCQRLQRLVEPVFDREFKIFLKQKGVDNIDPSLFDIELNTPQHFSDYTRIEKQTAEINLFTQLVDQPMFSKRWLMLNVLGLTHEEIAENERLWLEENPQDEPHEQEEHSHIGVSSHEMPDLGDMSPHMRSDEPEPNVEPDVEPDVKPTSGEDNAP